MQALILDTSQDICYLIYVSYGKPITLLLKQSAPLSQNLSLELFNLMQKENISLDNLSYIAVSIGPGSFTGLRVGASIVQALCYVKKIPIITFSSLMGYIPQNEGKFITVLDARSDEFFILNGEKKKDEITYEAPKLVTKEELSKIILDDTVIIPENSPIGMNDIFKGVKIEKRPYDPKHIIEITNKKFQKKDFSRASKIDLLYLKSPKA